MVADYNSMEWISNPAFKGGEGVFYNKVFTDDLRKTWARAGKDNSVTISCENGLSSVYIEFDQIPEQTWTITSSETGKTAECESKGFLHVFTDIT